MPRQGGRHARQSIANSEGTSGACCADSVRRIRALRLRAIRDAIIGWIEAAARNAIPAESLSRYHRRKSALRENLVFRWNDNHYALVSGDSSGVQYFVVQTIDGGNLLIEANENDHVYLLGRKLAKGTYGIVPIDQNDVDEATRKRACVTRNAVICTIETRRQLDVFVRAAAARTGGYSIVGVISTTAR